MSAPTEASSQRAIWLAVGASPGAVLFRLNSGRAWLGSGQPRRLQDGTLCLPGGRPVALGLALADGTPVVGQSDLYGWRSITITPEMVGRRVAVVLSIECKRPKGGRVSDDQRSWADTVTRAGGIAGIANSPEAALAVISNWIPPLAE